MAVLAAHAGLQQSQRFRVYSEYILVAVGKFEC